MALVALKILFGFLIVSLVVYIYLIYRRSTYLNHMEISRLINDKMDVSNKPFKLNVDKFTSRNPSLLSRLWNTSMFDELDWRRQTHEFVNNNK